jgi:hypothetical protein
MDQTTYEKLGRDHRSLKTVYMGHQRWLHKNNPWRKHGYVFNGKYELRGVAPRRSGEKNRYFIKKLGRVHCARKEAKDDDAVEEGMES